MLRFFSPILAYLLPHSCYFCQIRCSQQRIDLCCECEKSLYPTSPVCIQCCSLLTSAQLICGQCLKKPFFSRLICIGPYQTELRHLIIQFKFHNKLFIGQILSALLANKIKQNNVSLPECLIPVPLHKKRLAERGFNQSHEIAQYLHKILSIPVDNTLCKRLRYTQPQSEINSKKRERNVKNAFILLEKCSYNHIAIIDDVLTTGHTVQEMAKLFSAQGVAKIEIWCLARR